MAYGDWPCPEVGNAREAVESRSCILWDEIVLLRECPRHVARSVAGLHLERKRKDEHKARRTA